MYIHICRMRDISNVYIRRMRDISNVYICRMRYISNVYIHRMIEGRMDLDKSFERERGSARDLCIRGTKRLDDGTYQFTRDVRLNLVSVWTYLVVVD